MESWSKVLDGKVACPNPQRCEGKPVFSIFGPFQKERLCDVCGKKYPTRSWRVEAVKRSALAGLAKARADLKR